MEKQATIPVTMESSDAEPNANKSSTTVDATTPPSNSMTEPTATSPAEIATSLDFPEGDDVMPETPLLLYGAFCGVDFGSFQTVVASSSAESPFHVDIDLNKLSNRSTPSIMSYTSKIRLTGESAEDCVTSSPERVITQLTSFMAASPLSQSPKDLQVEVDALKQRMPWRLRGKPSISDKFSTDISFALDFNEKSVNVQARQLVALFINRCVEFTRTRRQLPCDDPITVAIALPDHMPHHAVELIDNACHVAGLSNFILLRQSQAIRTNWVTRNIHLIRSRTLGTFNDTAETPLPPMTPSTAVDYIVGFVDLGFTQTSIQFIRVVDRQQTDSSIDNVALNGNNNAELDVLVSVCDGSIGTADFANVLVKEALIRLQKEGVVIDMDSKKGWRLGVACNKLLKDLSCLPTGSMELEAFISDTSDFKMTITREEFLTLCTVFTERLNTLMTDAVRTTQELCGVEFVSNPVNCPQSDVESSESPITVFCGVEIVGGGTRIPWVQNIIEESVGGVVGDIVTSRLRRTMDSSAATAFGATLLAAGQTWSEKVHAELESWSNIDASMDVAALVEAQEADDAVEAAELFRRENYNTLESYIIQVRSALTTRKDLFEGVAEKVEAEITAVDEWLLDDSSQTATCEEYKSKLSGLDAILKELCKNYFDTTENERRQKEESFTQNMMNKPQDENQENHDDRKLPNSQRLKLAKKNKDEGNELYKSGSLELSARRYVKALLHTSKLFDLSPEEAAEKKSIENACHLNLAQVYLRLDTDATSKKAVASCDSAIALTGPTAKCLFRRSCAYEKLKEFNKAFDDLKQAEEFDVENAEVRKAITRVKRQLKIEEDRTKKMYSRMLCSKAD